MLAILHSIAKKKVVTSNNMRAFLASAHGSSLGLTDIRELLTLRELEALRAELGDTVSAKKGVFTCVKPVANPGDPDFESWAVPRLNNTDNQIHGIERIEASDLYNISINSDKISLCIAGGAVKYCVNPGGQIKDLDVFFMVSPLVPLSKRERLVLETIEQICDYYLKKGKADEDYEVRCIVQGKYVTTIVFEQQLPIQLIHRAYEAVEGDMTDPRNVIHGFDIYASQLAYTADSSKRVP